MSGLFRRIFSISPNEVRFSRRGFRAASPTAQARLEGAGLAFLAGYHAALAENKPSPLAARLEQQDAHMQGFAFEGAAMALALLDHVTPWRRGRWHEFVEGPGARHAYMVHVGVGWALARLRRGVERFLARNDPLLGWLAVDGYGFHEGYFHWRRCLEARRVPARLHGYAVRAFDQGLGRSLWFVGGGDANHIQERISAFPVPRQADLWSGIGLAATYAGGVGSDVLADLARHAGPYRAHLAQGAAFAAKARQRAGNLSGETENACRIFCGLSAEDAARCTDDVLGDLPASGDPLTPPYEMWRRGLEKIFEERTGSSASGAGARGA